VTVLSGYRRIGMAACLSVTLAGCGGLFHSDAHPEQVYVLRAEPIPADSSGAAVAASLRMNRPTANPGLDSAQIILMESDRRMSFFAASRWAAPASNLVEMLAVEKLRASGTWQSVADSTSAFPSDYVLQTTIRRFEADYTGGEAAPEVHVVLDCLVGKREGREVIANFLATGSARAAANRMSAVVPAFEAATNAALDSMAAKTAAAVRDSLAHKAAP
jgi:cholesterol transport system auxiliary component